MDDSKKYDWFWTIVSLVVALIIGVVLFYPESDFQQEAQFIESEPARTTASYWEVRDIPCDGYRNVSLSNMPARCINHFLSK